MTLKIANLINLHEFIYSHRPIYSLCPARGRHCIQAGQDSAVVKDFNTALRSGPDSLIITLMEKHRLPIVWPPTVAMDGSTVSVNSREGCVMKCGAKFLNSCGCLPFARSTDKPACAHFCL